MNGGITHIDLNPGNEYGATSLEINGSSAVIATPSFISNSVSAAQGNADTFSAYCQITAAHETTEAETGSHMDGLAAEAQTAANLLSTKSITSASLILWYKTLYEGDEQETMYSYYTSMQNLSDRIFGVREKVLQYKDPISLTGEEKQFVDDSNTMLNDCLMESEVALKELILSKSITPFEEVKFSLEMTSKYNRLGQDSHGWLEHAINITTEAGLLEDASLLTIDQKLNICLNIYAGLNKLSDTPTQKQMVWLNKATAILDNTPENSYDREVAVWVYINRATVEYGLGMREEAYIDLAKAKGMDDTNLYVYTTKMDFLGTENDWDAFQEELNAVMNNPKLTEADKEYVITSYGEALIAHMYNVLGQDAKSAMEAFEDQKWFTSYVEYAKAHKETVIIDNEKYDAYTNFCLLPDGKWFVVVVGDRTWDIKATVEVTNPYTKEIVNLNDQEVLANMILIVPEIDGRGASFYVAFTNTGFILLGNAPSEEGSQTEQILGTGGGSATHHGASFNLLPGGVPKTDVKVEGSADVNGIMGLPVDFNGDGEGSALGVGGLTAPSVGIANFGKVNATGIKAGEVFANNNDHFTMRDSDVGSFVAKDNGIVDINNGNQIDRIDALRNGELNIEKNPYIGTINARENGRVNISDNARIDGINAIDNQNVLIARNGFIGGIAALRNGNVEISRNERIDYISAIENRNVLVTENVSIGDIFAERNDNVEISENERIDHISAIENGNVLVTENVSIGDIFAERNDNVEISKNERIDYISAIANKNVFITENDSIGNILAERNDNVTISKNGRIDYLSAIGNKNVVITENGFIGNIVATNNGTVRINDNGWIGSITAAYNGLLFIFNNEYIGQVLAEYNGEVYIYGNQIGSLTADNNGSISIFNNTIGTLNLYDNGAETVYNNSIGANLSASGLSVDITTQGNILFEGVNDGFIQRIIDTLLIGVLNLSTWGDQTGGSVHASANGAATGALLSGSGQGNSAAVNAVMEAIEFTIKDSAAVLGQYGNRGSVSAQEGAVSATGKRGEGGDISYSGTARAGFAELGREITAAAQSAYEKAGETVKEISGSKFSPVEVKDEQSQETNNPLMRAQEVINAQNKMADAFDRLQEVSATAKSAVDLPYNPAEAVSGGAGRSGADGSGNPSIKGSNTIINQYPGLTGGILNSNRAVSEWAEGSLSGRGPPEGTLSLFSSIISASKSVFSIPDSSNPDSSTIKDTIDSLNGIIGKLTADGSSGTVSSSISGDFRGQGPDASSYLEAPALIVSSGASDLTNTNNAQSTQTKGGESWVSSILSSQTTASHFLAAVMVLA
ncbi:MAG: hypothetical protein WC329_08130, partial [Candidatus Omnitrophota bacterium]